MLVSDKKEDLEIDQQLVSFKQPKMLGDITYSQSEIII